MSAFTRSGQMAHTLSEINVLPLIARAAARETNANLMGNGHPSPAPVFQLRLRNLKQVGFEIDFNNKNYFFFVVIWRIGLSSVTLWLWVVLIDIDRRVWDQIPVFIH